MTDYANHPALRAIVQKRDRYCMMYPRERWSDAYLVGLVDAYNAVARVVSPEPWTVIMPDPPSDSDTRPKDGDAPKIAAPLASSADPKGIAHNGTPPV